MTLQEAVFNRAMRLERMLEDYAARRDYKNLNLASAKPNTLLDILDRSRACAEFIEYKSKNSKF